MIRIFYKKDTYSRSNVFLARASVFQAQLSILSRFALDQHNQATHGQLFQRDAVTMTKLWLRRTERKTIRKQVKERWASALWRCKEKTLNSVHEFTWPQCGPGASQDNEVWQVVTCVCFLAVCNKDGLVTDSSSHQMWVGVWVVGMWVCVSPVKHTLSSWKIT